MLSPIAQPFVPKSIKASDESNEDATACNSQLQSSALKPKKSKELRGPRKNRHHKRKDDNFATSTLAQQHQNHQDQSEVSSQLFESNSVISEHSNNSTNSSSSRSNTNKSMRSYVSKLIANDRNAYRNSSDLSTNSPHFNGFEFGENDFLFSDLDVISHLRSEINNSLLQADWLLLQEEWLTSKNVFNTNIFNSDNITNNNFTNVINVNNLNNDIVLENIERARWSQWAIKAAEIERQRRVAALEALDRESDRERRARIDWAIEAIERERSERITNQFLSSLTATNWFNETISVYHEDYALVCPYYRLGCRDVCTRKSLDNHLKECIFAMECNSYNSSSSNISSMHDIDTSSFTPHNSNSRAGNSSDNYDVVCPNSVLGCTYIGGINDIYTHLKQCKHTGQTMEQEMEERSIHKRNVILECEEERRRRVFLIELTSKLKQAKDNLSKLNTFNTATTSSDDSTTRPTASLHQLLKTQISSVTEKLHDQALLFYNHINVIQSKNSQKTDLMISRLRVAITALWPYSKVLVYGSYATGLHSTSSDIDLVVCFCDEYQSFLSVRGTVPLLHALADHLRRSAADVIEINNVILHSRVPIIKASAAPMGLYNASNSADLAVDISIDCAAHSGLATTEMVRTMLHALPPLAPAVTLFKSYLQSKDLYGAYNGGLSNYAIVLMTLLPLLRRLRKPKAGSSLSEDFIMAFSSIDRNANISPERIISSPLHEIESLLSTISSICSSDGPTAAPTVADSSSTTSTAVSNNVDGNISTGSSDELLGIISDAIIQRIIQPTSSSSSSLLASPSTASNDKAPVKRSNSSNNLATPARVSGKPRGSSKSFDADDADENPTNARDDSISLTKRSPPSLSSALSLHHNSPPDIYSNSESTTIKTPIPTRVRSSSSTITPMSNVFMSSPSAEDSNFILFPLKSLHRGISSSSNDALDSNASSPAIANRYRRSLNIASPNSNHNISSLISSPNDSSKRMSTGTPGSRHYPYQSNHHPLILSPNKSESLRKSPVLVSSSNSSSSRYNNVTLHSSDTPTPAPRYDFNVIKRQIYSKHFKRQISLSHQARSQRMEQQQQQVQIKQLQHQQLQQQLHQQFQHHQQQQQQQQQHVDSYAWHNAINTQSNTRGNFSWTNITKQVDFGRRVAMKLLNDSHALDEEIAACSSSAEVNELISGDSRSGNISSSSISSASVTPPRSQQNIASPIPPNSIISGAFDGDSNIKNEAKDINDIDIFRNKIDIPILMTLTTPILGEIIEEFLTEFGDYLQIGLHGFSVRDGGFRFDVVSNGSGCPAHPQADDPLVVEDPVNVINNVAKSCYRASAVHRAIFDAHERLKNITVRCNDSNSSSNKIRSSSSSSNSSSSSVSGNSTIVDDLVRFEDSKALLQDSDSDDVTIASVASATSTSTNPITSTDEVPNRVDASSESITNAPSAAASSSLTSLSSTSSTSLLRTTSAVKIRVAELEVKATGAKDEGNIHKVSNVNGRNKLKSSTKRSKKVEIASPFSVLNEVFELANVIETISKLS